jgi:predicted Rossmann fold nucleotide-binding protein DprA/Smf involved in DNA uptake
MIEIQYYIGNYELLKLSKTGFLCSRKVPASAVLKCYDWAILQREEGNCVISGFHSKLEKDVLHFLLKGKQPIILVLARGIKKRIEPEFQQAIEQGRLLIITPFPEEVKRVTATNAQIRNELMVELADNITVGFISKGGLLEELLRQTTKITINIGQ